MLVKRRRSSNSTFETISGPNENSPKANISVYVLTANSHDGVFERTTRPRPENKKNALILDDEMNGMWNRRKKSNTLRY